jgi:hypothetical protein
MRELPVLSALHFAGAPHRREGGFLRSPCPACDGELWVRQSSFICTCGYRAGAMDYLRSHLKSYEACLEGLGVDSAERGVEAKELTRNRELVEFLETLSTRSRGLESERILLRQSFNEVSGGSPDYPWRSQLFLTSGECNTLILLLAQLDYQIPPGIQGRPCTVFVFWSKPHIPSMLMVGPRGTRKFHAVDLQPASFRWFGLAEMRPACEEIDVWPSLMDVVREHTRLWGTVENRLPLCMSVMPERSMRGMMFKSVRFIASLEEVRQNLARWSCYPEWTAARFVTDVGQDLDVYRCLEELYVHQADAPQDFADFCGTLRLTPEVRAFLLEFSSKLPEATRKKLRRTISRILIRKDEEAEVYETSDGYEVKRRSDLATVTNFSIHLESITGYAATHEISYAGSLCMGQVRIPVEFPGMALENSARLGAFLQSLQINTPEIPEVNLVEIKEPKLAKYVLQALRANASDLPRHRGIRTLGWSRRFDRFNSPLGVVDSRGVATDIRYVPSDDSDFHPYDVVEPVPGAVSGTFSPSPEICDMIGAMIAQTVRLHNAMPVELLRVRNTEEARVALLALFSRLGQTAVVRLRSILPRDLEANRGFPALFAHANELQIKKMPMAGVCLSESGAPVQWNPEEARNASEVFAQGLMEVVKRLLSGALTGYRERRSVLRENSLLLEGSDLLRGIWPEWPLPRQKWATVDRLLEERRAVICASATLDTHEDLVRLGEEILRDFDTSDLAIEMGCLCKEVKLESSRLLAVDRPSFYRLADTFYGEPLILEAAAAQA